MKVDGIVLAIMLGVLLAVNVLFDTYLGTLFTGMILGSIALLLFDQLIFNKDISVKLSKERNPLKYVIWAIGGSLAVWIIPTLIMQGKFDLGSMVQMFADVTPYFKGNQWFTVGSFGFVVGFSETYFIWRLMEIIGDAIGIKFKLGTPWKNYKLWGLILLSAAFFSFLHLTSKQGGSLETDLLIVAFMWIVTCIIVLLNHLQLIEAVLMHIMLNTTAILVQKGILVEPYLAVGASAAFITVLAFGFNALQKNVNGG